MPSELLTDARRSIMLVDVDELKTNRRLSEMPAEEAAVYDFVTELICTHEVSDAMFEDARQLFSKQQVMNLTAVVGTYVTIASLLAMADQGVPNGEEFPFKPGEP